MPSSFLFAACVLIWGSTWLAITFQLGEVDPGLSVAYRFTLASILLGTFCLLRRLPMRLPLHIHVKMAAVGLSLYTLDYTLLYQAQQYIVSAVVALMSSSIIYINVVLRRVLLKKPIRLEVIVGSTLGMAGIGLIFIPEFTVFSATDGLVLGIILAMVSFLFASIGNVVSERILDHGTPVIQMNFYAMSYGLVFMYGGALLSGTEFVLPDSQSYWLSLLYLALFGSVLGFGAYMKLLSQIGSDKAAYVVLMYPIVALLLSTLFEGYQWHWFSALGVVIVLFGNAIAMDKIPLPRARKKVATAD
ncbi:DMT family transporter [Aestuariibacter salexigens]|uniref:DMT family transporter n=1 Tax=Aestuariibacter salexigens TaxID=226010 RepID=UPI0004156A49|nr:EamA family transporter [Aestuariibacter salexigens]